MENDVKYHCLMKKTSEYTARNVRETCHKKCIWQLINHIVFLDFVIFVVSFCLIFICLVVLSLSCNMWSLSCNLVWFPAQAPNPDPCIGSLKS